MYWSHRWLLLETKAVGSIGPLVRKVWQANTTAVKTKRCTKWMIPKWSDHVSLRQRAKGTACFHRWNHQFVLVTCSKSFPFVRNKRFLSTECASTRQHPSGEVWNYLPSRSSLACDGCDEWSRAVFFHSGRSAICTPTKLSLTGTRPSFSLFSVGWCSSYNSQSSHYSSSRCHTYTCPYRWTRHLPGIVYIFSVWLWCVVPGSPIASVPVIWQRRWGWRPLVRMPWQRQRQWRWGVR